MSAVDFTAYSREALADGLVLSPPGREDVSLCAKPFLRPMRSLREVVERLVARARPRRMSVVAPSERFVTLEGEHAAAVTMEVETADGRRTGWVVAMVAIDDAFTLIEGTGTDPRLSELTIELARSIPGGGRDRARWFAYVPPSGWLGIRRPLATVWLSPSSDKRAVLAVCDAVPLATPVERTQDLLWPRDLGGDAARRSLRAGELWGEVLRRPGRAVADLVDRRYRYRVVEIGERDDRRLDRLIASIEPVPRSVRDATPELSAFEWLT